MENKTITIHVKMDKRILRSFAMFDTFRLQKKWKRPALFALILLAFAAACFLLPNLQQSALLGTVLLVVGLGLPVTYVVMFLSQVKEQAKKLRLAPPRKVYSLSISRECIQVTNNMRVQEDVRLEWAKMGGAFRVKNAIYLYATRSRAFILPNGQADASPDELWAMLVDNLPSGRAVDKR